ncbi:hypothetical protein CONLIGDRAFT_638170 [Coniochaeta ligniaria NRRL 30616]|uniref:HRQ family protein 2 n=1 Tax=Coniochaeta ligniaria NRRL 30616 TaxID=1408157 RepID=A0A1J7J4X6_9PEZI|nr:hypothetical protein CONLIGDRAFT_638170 [Coniochaeta ligniaria NRRL 30616]
MIYSYAAFGLFVVAILAASRYGLKAWRPKAIPSSHSRDEKARYSAESRPETVEAGAQSKLNWKDVEPVKFRPFKSTYYITMALQASAPSELILIDNNYEERVLERRKTMENHKSTVMGAIPAGHDAVRELYSFLLAEYLPGRHPSMFSLEQDGSVFRNHVTNQTFSTTPPADPLEAFKVIGETVEDDVFLLKETDEGHLSVAFLCCHPAGFDPSTKLGKLLKDIHEPVPSYEKIGPSMERFFRKVKAGQFVKRLNWSITTQNKLFTPSGTHIYEKDAFQVDEKVDIDQVRLRVELQTLTRLPKTGAVIFPFKTYLYPLKDVKDEGLGPQLVEAIEGLQKGNAPGMFKYKGAVRWGRDVCEYLKASG